MTADTDQPTLAVTQADRVMAAPYMGFAFRRVLNGECDDSGLVQQFARHRTNFERPAGDLREAAQRVVDDYPAAAGACASIEGGDGKPGWGSIRRLAEALAAHSPAPMAGEVDLHDVVTHRSAWRDAIILARDEASEGSEDPEADRCYWNHELRAFDRIFAKLAALAAPTSTQGV